MLYISDKEGRVDSAYHTLVQHIKSDVPIVMVSWVEKFIFNEALLNIKEAVLVCFCEYGWDHKIVDSHIWGVNKDTSGRYVGKEWEKFDNWVKSCNIKVMFKRELLKKDVSDKVKPIEYPCVVDIYPIQSKEDFDSRIVNVLQYWGRSNECRLRIHGEIWLHAFKKGFQPCDNLYYVNQYLGEEKGEKWITMWIPHWARIEIRQLMSLNNMAKLSLSWEGAGFKCFRTGEASSNSTMVMHRNDFAWSFDWDETNCILVDSGSEIEGIEAALNNPDLHKIYEAGARNCINYRLRNYLEHIESIIKNAI